MNPKAVLTDIEGTITSLSFVKETLFPYSKKNLKEFVEKQKNENRRVSELIEAILAETEISVVSENRLDAAVQQALTWIDEDKKIMPLKQLQGLIWKKGYQSGELKGHLYPDAYQKLKEWKTRGLKLYVYSSGSIKAQKLLFEHSCFGNILDLFNGFFDTQTGSKKEADSYKKIAAQTGFQPEDMLFLSDSAEELRAADQAGMQVTQLIRKEDYPSAENQNRLNYKVWNSFPALPSG